MDEVVVPQTADLGVNMAATIRLLLVEDDDGDALLVSSLLEESSIEVELVHVRSVLEAREYLNDSVDCVLLDLGLPDTQGLDTLHAILAASPTTAVVCLTGLDDEHRGVVAVAAGAQDYLIKGQVDAQLLRRAVQYAIERRRIDNELRRLYQAQVQAAENARLERGLLPHPRVSDPGVAVTTWYRPGRDAVLGGDFYDVVELDDGTQCVLIGDVAGHGPDEAALGVCMRIAWRSLILSGLGADKVLPVLQDVLQDERRSDEVFVTVAMAVVHPDRRRADVYLAGHPAPLLLEPQPVQLSDESVGPALGIMSDAAWKPVSVDLSQRWRLVLFTDGLIEGRVGNGPERLGVSGLVSLLAPRSAEPDTRSLIDGLVDEVTALNRDELPDDVAVVVLTHPYSDRRAAGA